MKIELGHTAPESTSARSTGAAMDPSALKHYPNIRDLASRIQFAPDQGRIWLDDQRMVMVHASALGILRRELVEGLGVERARGLLTRIGYNSGVRDAELGRRLRKGASPRDALFVGPQLHMLEGVVRVEPVRTEIDAEHGHFYGEFLWRDSAEDAEYLQTHGFSADPVCWMQIGYASGYTSVFMGRPVLFREVECRAQGHACCRIVGKCVDEWEDAEEDLQYLRAVPFTQGLSAHAAPTQTQTQTHHSSEHPGACKTPDHAATAAPLMPLCSEPLRNALGDADVVGVSAPFNSVCHMVRRVADTDATVLFLGESGVGKEVLARTLHRIGPRRDGPFIAVNCAAIPAELIEAELFGVEKGAYTGALQTRPGRFERAHGGTLFLDEIGILSYTAQGKLLRALQEREVERVGGCESRKVDVRVVAATNLNLIEEIRASRFREDLYFRLNVFPILVPPLRERREDIPVFMNHFLRKYRERHRRNVTGFSGRAIDAMLTYQWPGNIRELENVVERGVILAPDGGAIDRVHLFTGGEQLELTTLGVSGDGQLRQPGEIADIDPSAAAEQLGRKVSRLLAADGEPAEPISLDELESQLLQSAVERAEGNLSAAARLLGITRPQFVYRLKSRGLRS